MSSRPVVKTAFQNLRPTILRQPTRSVVSPEDEARLLDSPIHVYATSETTAPTHETAPSTPFTGQQDPTLLTKKKKELLVPVTFRMPQSLKEKLERTARQHEVNQTDLINEAIYLNLQRYS